MMVVICGVIGLFSIFGLLAVRSSFYSFLLFLATITITLQFIEAIWVGSSILLWLIVISGIVFSIDSIRRKIFTEKLLDKAKEHLPAFNALSSEVLSQVKVNNEIWFEESVLRGSLNVNQLLQAPKVGLTAKEQAFLNNQVETLCQTLNSWKITQDKLRLPSQVWEYLRQQKFFAMNIPIEQGGLGFSGHARFEIIQKIATRSISAVVTVMVPNSFELVKLLLKYGTQQQQEEYLSYLVSGEYIPTFALNYKYNTGVVCYQKYQDQEMLGVCLNWDERKILLAPIANLLILAIKLSDPNDFLNLNTKDLGVNICLVPTKLPNIFNNLYGQAINQDFLNGSITGKKVFIPLHFVIGNKEKFGKHYDEMLDCLSIGRDLSFLTLSTAINKLCLKNTSAHSVVRTKNELSVLHLTEVANNLAKVSGYNYMLEAIRNCLLTVICSDKCSLEAVIIAKNCLTSLSKEIVSATTDIYGSNFTLGIKNHLVTSYQVSIAKLFNSNILMAISRFHPFLSYERESIEDKNVILFDHYFFEHISFALSNFAKMLLHASTNKLFCSSTKHLKSYTKNLNFFSIVFSCLLELSLLKSKILVKNNERLSALLWGIFSNLTMGCAIVRYHHQNQQDPVDLSFAKWGLQICFYKIQQNILDVLEIFPNNIFNKLLKKAIFPFGTIYRMPSKELGELLSNAIVNNSSIRTRLLSGCYISYDDQLEVAFKKVLNIASIKQQVAEPNVLTNEVENNLIKEAMLAVKNATLVDEFGA